MLYNRIATAAQFMVDYTPLFAAAFALLLSAPISYHLVTHEVHNFIVFIVALCTGYAGYSVYFHVFELCVLLLLAPWLNSWGARITARQAQLSNSSADSTPSHIESKDYL